MLLNLLPLAVLPLAAGALTGLSVRQRRAQEPGLLRLPITTFRGSPSKNTVFRRQQDVALVSQLSGFIYTIDVNIGTPPQAITVNFDTGSDELWVNPVCAQSIIPAFCETFKRFNGSQTFHDIHQNGSIVYGSGYANFSYGYDYVQIGSAKISQQRFGVATSSAFATNGIMGFGPNLEGWNSSYPLIIDNMVKQGFTNSRAFSLDIRSYESPRGSVIFGGIDTRKFTGSLEKRPIVPASASPDKTTRYWIYLDDITITSANRSAVSVLEEPDSLPVILDSGSTLSILPQKLFDKVLAAFPDAVPSGPGSKLYTVPCSVGGSDGRVGFKFGKTVIEVPYKDFFWTLPDNTCILGVASGNFTILGDTFLRAAYVVYDWDNRNIHLASAKDCGSKLVAIGKGPDSVPSLAGECGAVSTSSSSSSFQSQPTSTGTSSGPASPTTISSGPADPPTTSSGPANSTTTSSGPADPPPTSSGPANATTTSSGPSNATTTSSGSADPPTTSSGPSNATTTSSGPANPTTTSSGPAGPPTTSSGPANATTTSSGPANATTTSSGPANATTTSSGPADPPTTSSGPANPPTTSSGPANATTTSSGPAIATTTSSGPADPPTISSGPANATTTSSGPANPPMTSSGPANATTTSSGPVDPTTASSGPADSTTASSGPANPTTASSGPADPPTASSGPTDPETTSSGPAYPPTTSSDPANPSTTSSGPAKAPTTTAGGGTSTTVPRAGPSSASPTYTSIFTSTRTHTVTSCPKYVTGCPIGSVTTETITGTTTWSSDPSTATAPPSSMITSVFLTTMTHTVTDCHGQEPCSKGLVTTVVLTSTTYVCPESTATWTMHHTRTCSAGGDGCAPDSQVTHVHTVTSLPSVPSATTGPESTPVYSCTSCEKPSWVETTAVQTVSPIQTSPSETYPAESSPAESSPAESSPAESSPAESYPAESSPVESSPTESSPAQTSPAQTSLLETSSVQGPPSQTTPAQTLPTSNIPGPIGTASKPSASPCTTCGSATSSPPPVVAGAALWRAPGVIALALGALAVAAM